jgi:hypothetical protein
MNGAELSAHAVPLARLGRISWLSAVLRARGAGSGCYAVSLWPTARKGSCARSANPLGRALDDLGDGLAGQASGPREVSGPF